MGPGHFASYIGRMVIGAVILLTGTPRFVFAQERGAAALGEAVTGIGVNTRVLVIGAHPDDEDTFLIAWLSRGRHVATAYLSLTRGDGGQNLIGNELGEALGVIRTEELLAARRVDGAQQFFTRAFDFGFSKDTVDTYAHWSRDSILGDVVRVVRAFRPHVIVAVFSGTPRDGHGHHQVSGLLARAAYEVANDTVHFPPSRYGPPWTPLKFYRNARYDPTGGTTLRFDVGEYSPLLGRSYAEIAGESRSQHKSQGFGTPQRMGSFVDALRREASRANESTPAEQEASIFDGIDTTWARFRTAAPNARARAALDSLPAAFAAARRTFDAFHPEVSIPSLARTLRLVRVFCPEQHIADAPELYGCRMAPDKDSTNQADLFASVRTAEERLNRSLAIASGLEAEASAAREAYPARAASAAVITVSEYNRGSDTILVSTSRGGSAVMPPGGMLRDSGAVEPSAASQPWWLARPRRGAMFDLGGWNVPERDWAKTWPLNARIVHDGDSTVIHLAIPVIYRFADRVKGDVKRLMALVPAISVTLDDPVQLAPANTDFSRTLEVNLRSAEDGAREAQVSVSLPKGLVADSAVRTARLAGYDARQTVTFRLRGRLPVGEHRISVAATSGRDTFTTGYDIIDYDHIRRQRVYRSASVTISAIEMTVPATLRVAYVAGVSDNVAPMLAQLGIPVTVIAAEDVAHADLQPYTTVVVGPRAYEAHPALLAANPHLFEFARKGGTVVVQYGQYEMTRPGVMPYPITMAGPADRVTHEDAPVVIDAPNDKLLRSPNRIGPRDFAAWVQERALYMPHTFDTHYRSLLSMNDPGEPPNGGAILVAPLGEGQYIYTTLSIFRQLPAGVPGGTRLFLNLLSAGLVSAGVNP